MNIGDLEKLAERAEPGPYLSFQEACDTDNLGRYFSVTIYVTDNHVDGAWGLRGEYLRALTPETILKLLAVVKAAQDLRYKNKFDGTWVEASDWEKMRDAIDALDSGEPK